VALVRELVGMPRHLSQHVGGFVISQHSLHTLVPVENAAMPDRTIIQWDKEDLEALGCRRGTKTDPGCGGESDPPGWAESLVQICG